MAFYHQFIAGIFVSSLSYEANLIRKLSRLPSKAKREFLRSTYLGNYSKQRYLNYIQQYQRSLPKLDQFEQNIVEQIKAEGCATLPLERLGLPLSSSIFQALPRLAYCPPGKSCTYLEKDSPIREDLLRDFFLWGLQERLLDIVTNYLGLPPFYAGMVFRKDPANGQEHGFRQWHQDPEDYRVVKIIIYLNSVNLNGGPFEYIARSNTAEVANQLSYNEYQCGYIQPRLFKLKVPDSKIISCLGSAGTVVIADTHTVFHRQRPIINTDRLSLTYCYTSKTPLQRYSEYTFFRRLIDNHWQQLTQRQKDCLTVDKTYGVNLARQYS